MIRALLATAAAAAASFAGYKLYRSGRLDGALRYAGLKRPPALDEAYTGRNASQPAPAHPWPVDPLSLGKGAAPDAAHAT